MPGRGDDASPAALAQRAGGVRVCGQCRRDRFPELPRMPCVGRVGQIAPGSPSPPVSAAPEPGGVAAPADAAALNAGGEGRSLAAPGEALEHAVGGWESKIGSREAAWKRDPSLEERSLPWQQPPSRLQLRMDYSGLARRSILFSL